MQIKDWLFDLLLHRLGTGNLDDCFLIDIEVSKQNKIRVIIDADNGVTFEKCRIITRFLEEEIDKSGKFGDEYVLEVSSPGIERPLEIPRQYNKNIGRKIRVTQLEGDDLEGILKNVSETLIEVETETTRKEGKKKIKEVKLEKIQFDSIKKAIVVTQF